MYQRRFATKALFAFTVAYAAACAEEAPGTARGEGGDAAPAPLASSFSGLLRGDGSEFESGGAASGARAGVSATFGAASGATAGVNATCCSDGDCVCRGPDPTASTPNGPGPFATAKYSAGIRNGPDFGAATIYYPTNAQPPLSGVVMCPGYTATQSSIAAWGPFFASHGIVLMTIDTNSTLDQVDERDDALLDALTSLKAENARTGSPLQNKLSANRYGVAGWSMGGGGTWIASAEHPELKSAITLAGHNATAIGGALISLGSQVPTLMLNGALDTTILGGLGQSENAYDIIPDSTPKLLYVMATEGHFSWGTPTTNNNASGRYVLAWEKVFLEGDERYRSFLLQRGPLATTFLSNLD
jgi:dienelactone hydrolase